MTHAGAVVFINAEGEASIFRGLMREADRRAVAAVSVDADKVADRAETESVPDVDPIAWTYSDALAKRLAAHRRGGCVEEERPRRLGSREARGQALVAAAVASAGVIVA